MTGVFDKMANKDEQSKPVLENKPKVEKQDFKGVHAQAADIQSERVMGQSNHATADQILEKAANDINNVSMGGKGNNADKDIKEAEEFSKEDLEHAQQLFFRGYAEFEASLPQFPNKKFTICTVNSEEMSVIDEVVLELLKNTQDKDGDQTMSDNSVGIFRNNCYIAMSYRGMNKEEISKDATCHLNALKSAVIKYNNLLADGELKDAQEFRKVLIKNIHKRSRQISRMSNQMLDFLSNQRVEFDKKMAYLINTKEEIIIPKS